MKSIFDFGWNSAFEAARIERGCELTSVGRVIEDQRERWKILGIRDGSTVERWAVVSGRYRHHADATRIWPIIGDFCILRSADDSDHRELLIDDILPRKSVIARAKPGESQVGQILVSNVDKALIVSSMNAEFNPRRIERFVSSIWEGGVIPILALSKADAASDFDSIFREAEKCSSGAKVIAFSALTGFGMDRLTALFEPRETLVVLGSSGVGKSTLANALLGHSRQETSDVRGRDDKGRHTTTSRTILQLPSGALLIDTPGVREYGVIDAEGGVQTSFDEIVQLALKCRFTNCQHTSEPNCAVKGAIELGVLSFDRLNSFRKLEREAAYLMRRTNKALQSQEKQKWKKLQHDVRRK